MLIHQAQRLHTPEDGVDLHVPSFLLLMWSSLYAA